ncbi:acyl-CoA synthetase [Denitratisoma oestradiolicum]|uniref:3-oxocholest-4-en-26-oate--CoA ligase n=1 Tax=Denitratisoma oestradiolicum TaxID=311182 RepID=A0A6S6XZ99_9PROT|nr:acyl-CoA synthetase [Denitratisoma oestradiolicum]TWO79974.1 long-chain fatty acid--CoA ligase [Denitratisoma oestradiolicum]CAB1369737.1 3-oxocholest-4-en-26-oate--CoA ligase [Denitratisoma oestradiolicum]
MTQRSFNLADLLEIVTEVKPDQEALVCNDERRTLRQLMERSAALARYLHAQGLRPGDNIGIHAYNCIEFMEASIAAFMIRAVPVNVNYRYTVEETRYVYDNAELKALVYEGGLEDIIAPALDAAPACKILVRLGTGKGLLPQAVGFEDAMSRSGPDITGIQRADSDTLLLYTGGTTGMPKGVIWTHKDVFFGGFGGGGNFCPQGPVTTPEELAERVRENFPVVHMACGPLMHGAGFWATMIGLLSGHKVVLNGRPDFNAEYVLDMVQRERVTIIMVVGDAMCIPLADALQKHPGRWDLSSIFVVSSAGALFSDHVRDALKAHLPANAIFSNGMGSSESGQVGTGAKPEGDGLIRLKPDAKNAVAIDGVRFGKVGETGILVRKGYLPLGYYKDPKKTAETFVQIEGQRCVLIGDIARQEEDGSITMFGRNSQCINTGGEKVFTEEVEEAVRSFDGVFDALVVGVPDSRWGQKVVAVVALRPDRAEDADALKAHCRQRLAGYKVPKDIIFVDEVRRNPVGKADYRWAKATAEQRLTGA